MVSTNDSYDKDSKKYADIPLIKSNIFIQIVFFIDILKNNYH